MPYNPPAIIYHIYLPTKEEEGSIWEHSRFHIEPYEVTYNKLVRVLRKEDKHAV